MPHPRMPRLYCCFPRLRALLGLLLLGCSTPMAPPAPRRIATWTTAQQDFNEALPGAKPLRTPVTLKQVTLRQIAHVSLGGTDVRIKLSNLLGTAPVQFSAGSVALSAGGSLIDPATRHDVTFGGAEDVTVAPHAEVWSDPIAWKIPDNADLAVSFYLPTDAPVGSVHLLAAQTQYIAQGNATTALTLMNPETMTSTYWLAAVDVTADPRATVLVAFGDSLTDGVGSTDNANHRWTNALEASVRKQSPGTPLSVVNAGIGGNRWLHDLIGPSGADRFAHDVLAVSGVTHVVLWLGINDIGESLFLPAEEVTAEDIEAAISKATAAAQAAGVRVCVATLTPFGGAMYYTDAGEAKRQAVNAWIRSNPSFVVADFDAAVRDPASPTALPAAYDSGDALHMTDAGYARVAAAIPAAFLTP